jgi:dolichol-phosphate mannosyltransferase
MKKKISIVTPVYNESDNIDAYYERITKVVSDLEDKYEFELIITDNRSVDDTFIKAQAIAKKDRRVKLLRFSRNYGYQLSILTGYKHATGDAAIEFDCDLQDPPELLPEFLSRWEEGAQVVYGVRRKRDENALLEILRKVYYRFLRRVADQDLPIDAGDFMLLDRKILNILRNIEDPSIYIRGVVFSLGFRRAAIAYERNSRERGKSKFSLPKLVRLANDGLFSQSSLPLKLSGYAAGVLGVIAILTVPVYGAAKVLVGAAWPPGFATLISLLLFITAMNAFFFSILGAYLLRVYRYTQLQERVNIDNYVNIRPIAAESPFGAVSDAQSAAKSMPPKKDKTETAVVADAS